VITEFEEMVELEVDVGWREELKRVGEAQFRNPSNVGLTEEPKGHVGLRWSGDEAESRRLRDEQKHHYFQWTSVAVVAAIIVSLIVFSLTFLH
jgi:hypothetical protein